MLFENHHEAAKMIRPHPPVLHQVSPQRAPDKLRGGSLASPQPGVLLGELSLSRCCRKGCVFPAHPGWGGECAYHRRQSLEPGCFQSKQPTCLLLDQAKFGLPESEPDDSRIRDRHRLAMEHVRSMLEDDAA